MGSVGGGVGSVFEIKSFFLIGERVSVSLIERKSKKELSAKNLYLDRDVF